MNKPKTIADKYLKDGVTADEFWNAYIDYIDKEKLGWNAESFELFLSSPIKPTLTEDEKVILKHIRGKSYIGRFNDGTLYISVNKNFSSWSQAWCDLFDWIQLRRRI